MPPSPLGLELCVLEKVSVGIEQREVVGRPDRAVTEQGFVAVPPDLDGGFVERAADGVLVRVA
jgi:hypothetical protein